MNTPNPSRMMRGIPRLLVRCAFFAGATLCALALVPWRWVSLILPALSPYIALASTLARRQTGGLLLMLGLPALAAVMLRRRFLCRYVCPVGLLNDQAARLHPGARGRFARFPHLGQWIALLTLGGACLGYPLFLWLDPFSIFNGTFSLFHKPLTTAAMVSGGTLLAVLLVSVWRPGLWCQRLCPLGATQELLALPRRWLRRIRPSDTEETAPAGKSYPLARRSVLALGVGGAWALTGNKVVRAAKPGAILPPGAAGPLEMNALCVRCGNCVRACPQQIIQPALDGPGIASFMTPKLCFDEEYCHPDCYECTRVCPSGAIVQLTLAAKQRFVIGLAHVDPDNCLAAQGGECNSCTMACTYDAIGGEEDLGEGSGSGGLSHGGEGGEGDENQGGEGGWGSGAPVVSKKKCVGCGACELVCPATPKAIIVRPISPLRK